MTNTLEYIWLCVKSWIDPEANIIERNNTTFRTLLPKSILEDHPPFHYWNLPFKVFHISLLSYVAVSLSFMAALFILVARYFGHHIWYFVILDNEAEGWCIWCWPHGSNAQGGKGRCQKKAVHHVPPLLQWWPFKVKEYNTAIVVCLDAKCSIPLTLCYIYSIQKFLKAGSHLHSPNMRLISWIKINWYNSFLVVCFTDARSWIPLPLACHHI